MLGLGLGITRLGGVFLPGWLRAFIKRVKGDGGTVEGKECVKADGEFLIKNTRAGIIVDAMGKYSTTYGGEGLEARDCSAQAVNDLIYSPRAQTRFMFLAEDLGTELESYYCVSNSIDDLEGDLAVFGSVTHTYGADISAGEIALSVENGEAPYTYSWSNGATVEDITGLTKGVYNIQVKDANGAIANNSFTVRGDADPSIVTAGLRMDSYFTDSALEFPALGSAEFNGTSDYIQLDTPFSYTNHTIAAWVYVEDDATNKYVFQSMNSGTSGIRIMIKSDEKIRYGLNSFTSDSTNFYTNEWVFVTATYNGTTAKLYIDGSQDQSANTSQTISTTTDARIGANSYSLGEYFNGNLANVAVWNRALHPDEINAIMWKSYGDLNAVDKSGLQAWYALDDINGTTVPDSTGTYNGTAN
jgi:hypothetical protein